MHIIYRDNQGQSVEHSFQIDLSKTVKDLKELLENSFGLQAQFQHIFYNGQYLFDNEKSLNHYGIGNGCKLELRYLDNFSENQEKKS